MFSTSTDGELLTAAWCKRCVHAYEGDQFCDEAAVILFGEEPPAFLVRVPTSRFGVECRRFEGATG